MKGILLMKEWNKIVFNVWYEKVVIKCIIF